MRICLCFICLPFPTTHNHIHVFCFPVVSFRLVISWFRLYLNNCSLIIADKNIYENLKVSKILQHVLGIHKTVFKSAKGRRKRGKGGTKCSNWDTIEIIRDGDGGWSKYKNFRKSWTCVSKNSIGWRKGNLERWYWIIRSSLMFLYSSQERPLQICKKCFWEGKDQRLFQTALI